MSLTLIVFQDCSTYRFSKVITTGFECDPTASGGIITCWVHNHKRLLSECNISKFRGNSSDEAEWAKKRREETTTTGLFMNLSSCIQHRVWKDK